MEGLDDEEYCELCLEPIDECACDEEDECPYCQCLWYECVCNDHDNGDSADGY